MKILKGSLNHLVLTSLLMFSLFLFAKEAFSQEQDSGISVIENSEEPLATSEASVNKIADDEPNDGTIEVIYAPEIQAPYLERQSSLGITAGLSFAEFYPDKFRSEIDNSSYDEIFQSYPMEMIKLDLGLKYNTGLGSFGVGGSIGYADVDGQLRDQNGNRLGGTRDLNVIKYALTGSYTLDTLFNEPYVVPYLGGEIFTLNWEEKDLKNVDPNKTSKSGSTSFALGVTAGILIQLNWIDPDSSLAAQKSSGLNNTFLDLYVNQFNTSNNEKDKNFETAMNLGGGIKLEF